MGKKKVEESRQLPRREWGRCSVTEEQMTRELRFKIKETHIVFQTSAQQKTLQDFPHMGILQQ